MDLKTYLDQPQINRRDFARRVGINPVYLSHIALGYRNSGECVALAIERESGGMVAVVDLRPDLAAALERGGYVRPFKDEEAAPESAMPASVRDAHKGKSVGAERLGS